MNVLSFGQWCDYLYSLKIEHSIQQGEAELNRMFNLSTCENNRTIELINIHYLYNIT